MMNTWSFHVVQGDPRQEYLQSELKKNGYEVVDISAPGNRRVVVVPLGAAPDDGNRIDRLGRGDVFFGRATPQAECLASEMGVTLVDLTTMEEFSIRNAVATTEGILALAMQKTITTLHGMDCLLLGYGRIGRLLADRLAAMGSHVLVASKETTELAWAYANNIHAIDLGSIDEVLPTMQLVINTIPAPVLPLYKIDLLPSTAVILDVASGEGCSPRDERVHRTPGLPGIIAPLTAARTMLHCILLSLSPPTNHK